MRVAILGRTRWLVDAADNLREAGHEIVAVATAKAEPFYNCEPREFSALALRSNAYDFGVVSLNDAQVRQRLAIFEPEIAVSINWPVLVRKEIIEMFPYGVLNAHCGDLPRYRGNACPNWAIINGEDRIGLCIHNMVEGELDSGPILLRDYIPVSGETYIGDVYAWLDSRIPDLLVEAVSGLEHGIIEPMSQPKDPQFGLRCYPRRPEDGRIDWSNSVETIHRLIRASSRPFAGAFTSFQGDGDLTIWRARPFDHPGKFCAVPGQIMLVINGRPVVACGDGAILIEEAEIEGMTFEETVRCICRSLRGRFF